MKLIHVSWAKIYQFKSITFDWHDYLGPTFLRRCDHHHRDPMSISGRQWGEFGQWCRMNKEEREKYRIF